MKIIDKINQRTSDDPFYSFEFFPPKTDSGLYNLYNRLERMAQLEPLFVDITWGAGGSTVSQTLEISKNIQTYFCVDVMMHLTCTNMPKSMLLDALAAAEAGGISNILALRGDPPEGQDKWSADADGFRYASDLTKFIRDKYNDSFGIGVGGYPEGHTEATDLDIDILNLKKKVESGADFIITQLFYDVEEFKKFFIKCRKAGISCPIIPGLLPITNYDRFVRFTRFCQTKVPLNIMKQLEDIKKDDAAVRRFGIDLCVKMCDELRDFGVSGFHFYTLNLETSVMEILKRLQLVDNFTNRRSLPWRPSTVPGRRDETVRPIFWSNRPKSYLARTAGWDDFPNGRWGDSRSPTFGDLKDYYMIRQGLEGSRDGKNIWSKVSSAADIKSVFKSFLSGELNYLPWCEQPPKPETLAISSSLENLIDNGFLTINSQPQVNGITSCDPQLGWGGDNGYIYQKAYVEFFASPDETKALIRQIKKCPTLTYQALNSKGESLSNINPGATNAVTWGVFPGKEVIQPTIVDAESFAIWKEEAFQLWLSEGVELFDAKNTTKKLLQEVHDSYYLVNIVENDYVAGDIFKPFRALKRSRNSSSEKLASLN